MANALKPLTPRLRGAPDDLPFTLDVAALQGGLNFTPRLSAGDLDLLGEVTGVGPFAVVRRLSIAMRVYDRDVRVLLERAKRATGRLKDLVDLEEILEIRRQTRSR